MKSRTEKIIEGNLNQTTHDGTLILTLNVTFLTICHMGEGILVHFPLNPLGEKA